MHDPLTFETRLADAYERYLAGAPVAVDARAIAAAAGATARAPSRRWLASTPTLARLALAAALLLGVTVGLAVVGSLLDGRLVLPAPTPEPLGANHILYVNGTYECQNLVEIDIVTGGSRVVLTCSNALLVSPNRRVAAERGPDGVVLIDVSDGSRQPIAIADGQFARPVAWSPSGRWLHWVACGPGSQACHGFIGAPSGTVRNPVPEPQDGGYNGSFQWSANEQHFFLGDDAGVHVAAGDGSGFVQNSWTQLPLAITPDGRSGAFAVGRNAPGGERLNGDLTLIDTLGGSQRIVTGYPDGTFVQAVAWSPDGTRIALITTDQGTSNAQNPSPTTTLRVIAGNGTEEQQVVVPFDPAGTCRAEVGSFLAWSPDGRRILVEGPSCSGPQPALIVVDITTRAQTALIGAQQPSWSPSGAKVVALEIDPSIGMRIVVWDVVTGERRVLATAESSDWSTVMWAP